MRILVTGAAGFIGMHVSRAFLNTGHSVYGIDNMNSYYSQQLKIDRISELKHEEKFAFSEVDLCDLSEMKSIFERFEPDCVVHLAAQAGVRYSLENPKAYYDSNIIGTGNILELSRIHKPQQLILASSSSVYGLNPEQPFNEGHRTDKPISLYAATKKSNEVTSYSYSHLFKIPITCLRFFTVYGPWGRPDMAPWLFTRSILDGETIRVFNHGNSSRDFTYIDDICSKILCLVDKPLSMTGDTTGAPHRILNIGSGKPQNVLEFIKRIESACKKEAKIELVQNQPGDVPMTYADTRKIIESTSCNEFKSLSEGISEFVSWFKFYHKIQ